MKMRPGFSKQSVAAISFYLMLAALWNCPMDKSGRLGVVDCLN